MQQSPTSNALKINYGHSHTHVIVQFSRATDNVHLTPEEAKAMVATLSSTLEHLAAHQAKKKEEGANGSGQ